MTNRALVIVGPDGVVRLVAPRRLTRATCPASTSSSTASTPPPPSASAGAAPQARSARARARARKSKIAATSRRTSARCGELAERPEADRVADRVAS